MSRVCLDQEQWTSVLGATRPRGRAWRHSAIDAFAGSFMRRVFRLLAAEFAEANAALCRLLDEFHCSSAVSTRDAWARDHGLPDPCDPFSDLCAKVNAVGDTTASYAIAALARAGFVATIAELHIVSSQRTRPGCSGFRAGSARVGAKDGVAWRVTVTGIDRPPGTGRFLAGRFRPGRSLGCRSTADAECILRRIMPAHAELILITA